MSDPRQRLQERARSLGELAGRITDQRAIEGVEVITLRIADLRRDGGTQARALINPDMVREYAEDMKRGDQFPPGVVFYDGQDYWLARGFTRVASAELNGDTTFDFEIRQGTRRDAVLFSVGENAEHGQRRTNEDKRRAVLTMLEDPEWGQLSSRQIAEYCHVSHGFVDQIRPSMATIATVRTEGELQSSENIRVTADGRRLNYGRQKRRAERKQGQAKSTPAAVPPVTSTPASALPPETPAVDSVTGEVLAQPTRNYQTPAMQRAIRMATLEHLRADAKSLRRIGDTEIADLCDQLAAYGQTQWELP